MTDQQNAPEAPAAAVEANHEEGRANKVPSLVLGLYRHKVLSTGCQRLFDKYCFPRPQGIDHVTRMLTMPTGNEDQINIGIVHN